MTPLNPFDRTLAALHRATLDDAHWPAAAAFIDEAIGAGGNALVIGEGLGDDVRVYFARYLYRGEQRPDRVRQYFDLYHPRDEGLPRLRERPHGQLVHVPDLYTEAELKTSAAYNEGLRRLGGQDGLNVRFDGPDGLRIVWASADPVGTGGWQSAQIEMVERLLPHIRQFVVVRQALAGAEALGGNLSALLDNRRIGVLHLDRRGRLVAANDPGLAVLRRGDALFDEGGTLHARQAADDARLQELLARALPGVGSAAPAGGLMTVWRPFPGAPLGLHVSPVGDTQATHGGRRLAALVLIVDAAERPHIDPVRVATALGLTPAEGRVAALLAEGGSVRDIAAATGHRQSYVRSLLRDIYRKQGLSGQVALVRRILTLDVLPED